MSTEMDGIYQKSIFSTLSSIEIPVPKGSKYRVLANCLPWLELAKVANEYRSKKVDINNGRPLNLRLHLGAYIAQMMNNWRDRETEEMVRYHGGVRFLCGVEGTTETIDHTSIEVFRNMLGADGAEAINRIVVKYAVKEGFTGSSLCSSDTTVQESPIAHPTEVGHLKNICGKLVGIGKKVKKKLSTKMESLQKTVREIVTKIRLFTRGRKKDAIIKKKKLAKKLHKTVSQMCKHVESAVGGMTAKAKEKYQEEVRFYRKIIEQIKQWIETGKHPSGKIISLWHKEARAITRNKVGKAVEFGRRWFISRLLNGYIIGGTCSKLGSDSDTNIAGEVLGQFIGIFGQSPETYVYDRGGDGPKNHKQLKELKVKNNCIFRKGKGKMEVGKMTFSMAKRERALSEASIATLKNGKYNFNKPRAKSEESCTTKGQMAITGANLNKLFKDLRESLNLKLEMG